MQRFTEFITRLFLFFRKAERVPCKPRCRAKRFNAPAPAAGTLFTMHIHLYMTEFNSETSSAAEDFAVQNYSSAKTCSERYKQ